MTTEEHIQQRVMKLKQDVDAMRKLNSTPNPNSIFSRYGNAIVDCEGRIAELEWVLSVMKSINDVQPQLNKHDVSGRSEQLPPSDAEIEDYFKSGYGGDAGSAIYGAKWMRNEMKSGGNCH